jgi:putative membrane protein
MLWLIAFHIIFVVCWFAGLFYLPRLFVYHAATEDPVSNARFKIMEGKLYYGIMTPSAIISIILGFWIAIKGWAYYGQAGWFHAKLLLVLLLIIYHLLCGFYLHRFKQDNNTHSHIFYRWFNEIPILLLVAIVILAVVKPF